MEHTIRVTPATLAAFGFSETSALSPLSGGHINDTFLVEDQGKFVLQRINPFVFPHPEEIMENIAGVTAFLREKILARGGNPDRETLSIRPTLSGEALYWDQEGGPWRCMSYVEDTVSYEVAQNNEMLREAGRAFGEFQNLLDSRALRPCLKPSGISTTPRSGSANCGRQWHKTRQEGSPRWGQSWTLPPNGNRTAPC